MRRTVLLALAACLMACEGGEIAIFAFDGGGGSGAPGASGASGAAIAGAAGAIAGGQPGGIGGSGGNETGGGGGAPSPACLSIDDCENGYYCSKQRCEDVQGSCVLLPIPEDDTSDKPVCGCDNNVYSNDTLRQWHGIAASGPGPCNSSPNTCYSDAECLTGGVCARYLPPTTMCGGQPAPMRFPGRCWVTPAECPAVNPAQYQVCPPPKGSGGGPQPCVSRCQAIKSGVPFVQLQQGQTCP